MATKTYGEFVNRLFKLEDGEVVTVAKFGNIWLVLGNIGLVQPKSNEKITGEIYQFGGDPADDED